MVFFVVYILRLTKHYCLTKLIGNITKHLAKLNILPLFLLLSPYFAQTAVLRISVSNNRRHLSSKLIHELDALEEII